MNAEELATSFAGGLMASLADASPFTRASAGVVSHWFGMLPFDQSTRDYICVRIAQIIHETDTYVFNAFGSHMLAMVLARRCAKAARELVRLGVDPNQRVMHLGGTPHSPEFHGGYPCWMASLMPLLSGLLDSFKTACSAASRTGAASAGAAAAIMEQMDGRRRPEDDPVRQMQLLDELVDGPQGEDFATGQELIDFIRRDVDADTAHLSEKLELALSLFADGRPIDKAAALMERVLHVQWWNTAALEMLKDALDQDPDVERRRALRRSVDLQLAEGMAAARWPQTPDVVARMYVYQQTHAEVEEDVRLAAAIVRMSPERIALLRLGTHATGAAPGNTDPFWGPLVEHELPEDDNDRQREIAVGKILANEHLRLALDYLGGRKRRHRSSW